MFAYYFVYFSSILISLSSLNKAEKLFMFGSMLMLLIGFKFEIGADWNAYLHIFDRSSNLTYFEIIKGESDLYLSKKDVLYSLINKLSYDLGFGITGVNFLIGMITSYGFIRLVYKENFQFLIIAIFFATLLIFNLSANRQALALGLVFWAWSLMNGNSKRMFKINVLFFIASTIHVSAVFPWFLTIVSNANVIMVKRYRFLLIIVVMFVSMYLTPIVIAKISSFNKYNHSYAALVRLFLNTIPAIIFLCNKKRFKKYPDYNLLFLLSLTSIGLFFLGYFFSTVADRLGYYCTILQPIVLSRFAHFLPSSQRPIYLFILFVLYTLVFYVVMNFSINISSFVPYKFMMFGSVFQL